MMTRIIIFLFVLFFVGCSEKKKRVERFDYNCSENVYALPYWKPIIEGYLKTAYKNRGYKISVVTAFVRTDFQENIVRLTSRNDVVFFRDFIPSAITFVDSIPVFWYDGQTNFSNSNTLKYQQISDSLMKTLRLSELPTLYSPPSWVVKFKNGNRQIDSFPSIDVNDWSQPYKISAPPNQ